MQALGGRLADGRSDQVWKRRARERNPQRGDRRGRRPHRDGERAERRHRGRVRNATAQTGARRATVVMRDRRCRCVVIGSHGRMRHRRHVVARRRGVMGGGGRSIHAGAGGHHRARIHRRRAVRHEGDAQQQAEQNGPETHGGTLTHRLVKGGSSGDRGGQRTQEDGQGRADLYMSCAICARSAFRSSPTWYRSKWLRPSTKRKSVFAPRASSVSFKRRAEPSRWNVSAVPT